MCGLCGVISNTLNNDEISVFQDLMTVSTLRGMFGAGLVAVPTAPKFQIETLKHASFTAAELAYAPEFEAIWKDKSLCVTMGHARQPTKGGTSLDDAHPHLYKHILGMHNGTLSSVMGQSVDDKSDSKMLFKSIAEKGLDETIKGTEGSYAISFIDKEKQELVFLRNSHRPLFFAHVGSLNTLFWASEASFLSLVLKRAFKTKGQIDMYRLPEDTATVFDIRPQGKIWPKSMFELKPEPKEAKSNVVPLLPAPQVGTETTYETYPRRFVTYKALRAALQKGCAFCDAQSGMRDYTQKKIYWVGPAEYICDHCAKNHKDAREYLLSMGIVTPTQASLN